MSNSEAHRPLVAIATLAVNRGPAHFFFEVLKTQVPIRPIMLICPDGHLADWARGIGVRHESIELLTNTPAHRLLQKWSSRGAVSRAVDSFVSEHGRPAILANGVGAALRSTLAARKHGSPVLTIVHSEFLTFGDVLRLRALRSLAPELRLFAVSPFTQGLLYGAKITSKLAVRPMPNIIPAEMFDLGRRRVASSGGYAPKERFELLFTGSNYRRKGFDILIGALEQLPELHSCLHVKCVGIPEDGPTWSDKPDMRRRVEVLRRELPIDFLGRREDMCAVLATADLAFLPSPLESFGRPVMEASAAGVPVVCSENPGHSCLVQHGVSALMFPVGRPDVAANAIRETVAHPEDARRRSEVAMELAKAYSPEALGPKITFYLDELQLPQAVSEVVPR